MIPNKRWGSPERPSDRGVSRCEGVACGSGCPIAIFAVLALGGAFLVAGWWALVPTAIFAVGLLVRLVLDPGDSTWGHAAWHILMALAVATTVYVMTKF